MINRTIVWVLAAMFPASEKLPGIGDLPTAIDRVAQLRAEAVPTFRLIVYVATALFLFSPLLTVGWPLPAFWLPRDKLDRHAYKLATHRIYIVRQATLMLKTAGGLIWGSDPLVRTELGQPLYGEDPGTFRTGGESWQELRDAGQPRLDA